MSDTPPAGVMRPPSHTMQVDTIKSALQGMQTKLAQVQKDIGEQLERYEYLVDDKTERSMKSTPEHDSSRPGAVKVGAQGSEQETDIADAGHASTAMPCGVARADASAPDNLCPGMDGSELTTYFQKQEQGHKAGLMQAAAETKALAYV